ncbi:MAG: hypothetical protein IJQ31_11815 [Thermoguttaceae bacterium]|nr:hypothetical protein [Thermoguttaceae bacterium]
MSKAKKIVCIVFSFVCAALLGSLLYGEKLSHENTKKELQEIVLQDIEQTEVFLKQNPDSLENWMDYLAIDQAKIAVNQPSEESNNDLFFLMMALKFTNGVKKYPVFVNLRESLGALLDWRKSNFLQTAFRNRRILSDLASSRSSLVGTEEGMVLVNARPELKRDQKMNLEKEFQNQMQGDLPCELPPLPYSETRSETETISTQDIIPNAPEQTNSEKAPHARRSRLYNKLQNTHMQSDESEDSEESDETEAEPDVQKTEVSSESSSQNDVLLGSSDSKPFILASTQPLTDFMASEEKRDQRNPFLNTPFVYGQFSSKVQPAAPRQYAASENQDQNAEKLIPSSDGSSIEELRIFTEDTPAQKSSAAEKPAPKKDFSNRETTQNSLKDPRACAPGSVSEIDDLQSFLSDSMPEAESENVKPEKQESAPARVTLPRKEVPRSAPLKPFTNRIPALPVLHYSLKETIGNASEVSEYEGQETIEDLQKKLVGDISKDLETVRKCWLLEEFKAPSDEDLTAAYENTQNAFNHFSATLRRLNEKKRQGWIQSLHLEALDLNGDPQLDVLQDVYRQLSNGSIGLELSVFVNFRESIKHYLTLVSIKNDPEQGGQMFAQARNRVVKLLEIVEKDHTSVIERALEDELNWLETAGQAENSVQATRRMWAKPNLLGQVGASIFERYGTRAVQEEEKISNQVQRASIYGTSNFNGSLVMRPVSNPDRIELEVALNGSSNSRTRAYAGPAVILSRAKSRIQVEKKIFFDEDGFSTNNAAVNIRTNSQIQKVQDIWNRQFIENWVLRRANARKEQTENATMAQSSARLRARFNNQVDQATQKWNGQMDELVHVHFRMRDLELLNTRLWSDEAGVHGQTLFSCREGMGACSTPPQVSETSDLQYAIHETALQSICAGFLGGVNLDAYARKHLKETAPGFLAKALQESESKENEKSRDDDWSIRFPKDWPVSISMQEEKLCCIIHCSSIDVNKKSYPAVDIIVAYTIELQEDGIHFVRQEEIEILPPDYDPDSNKRLPASMVSLRRVMGKRLQEALPPEIVLKEQPVMKNPPADSNFAKVYIKPIFVQAKDGWLQVGMNLFEKK